jgi:lipopolysaccharide transport system permease protein
MSAAAPIHSEQEITVIRPSRGWVPIRAREIWNYRELLYFLVWRDVKVRYKQTALGAAWAVLQPFLTMVVFTLLFGRLAKIPSDGVPYPVFAFCGLLPWQLFSFALNESGNSLISNQQLIQKVYFPRLVMPLARVLAGLVDFAIAFILLLALLVYYQIPLHARMLVIPLLVLFAMLTALAAGLWLSALNVEYRDVRHLIPFLTQLWLFVTPVVYPSTFVPERWRMLLAFNPMTGVVEGFRWALLGTGGSSRLVAVSVAVVAVLLLSGLLYFRRMERTFADVI